MRKFIMFVTALAALAIPSIASADVPRCEANVAASTTITTATFTALQPKDTSNQFKNVWKHRLHGHRQRDGTFTGTWLDLDNGGAFAWAETVTGSFIADRTLISFATVPVGGGATFQVTNAPYNVSVDVVTTWTANTIQMKITKPVITTATTTTPGTESVKNHGEYVKALGGGKVAAQECAGMPLDSTQGKSVRPELDVACCAGGHPPWLPAWCGASARQRRPAFAGFRRPATSAAAAGRQQAAGSRGRDPDPLPLHRDPARVELLLLDHRGDSGPVDVDDEVHPEAGVEVELVARSATPSESGGLAVTSYASWSGRFVAKMVELSPCPPWPISERLAGPDRTSSRSGTGIGGGPTSVNEVQQPRFGLNCQLRLPRWSRRTPGGRVSP